MERPDRPRHGFDKSMVGLLLSLTVTLGVVLKDVVEQINASGDTVKNGLLSDSLWRSVALLLGGNNDKVILVKDLGEGPEEYSLEPSQIDGIEPC